MADDLRVIVDADAEPLRRELASAGASVRAFGDAVTSSSSRHKAFSAAINKQKESLRGLGTAAKWTGLGIGVTFAVAVGEAIKVGADFEKQMARVQAVTGATGKEMDSLRKLAIKLGAATRFSAGQAAEAMYELSSAGFDAKETAKALPGTLSLAAASNVELADAAEISSNALRGFGLQSSQSTHVADVLAKSVNSSSAEMVDLQQSLKYIGPVARATGESFETMISAVSVMANAGIKGEQAGTSLRGGLLRLVKPTKQVEEGLDALGVSASELQGPHGLLPLPQLVAKLEGGMQGLSKSQQANALDSIFGKNALSGMLAVVDAGPQKLAKLTGEFEHSTGAAGKAAKTMNTTVAGSFEQLKGSFETVEIELFEHFQKPLREALMDATSFVNVQGERLQKALDEAMATPEFKTGNFEQKFDIIAHAFGKVWDEAGLTNKIEDGLVAAFNFAVPRVAAGAGQLGIHAAEGLVKGFFEADALGKLVIAGWLFSKFGGFAALRAAGAQAGREVAAGMAEGEAEGSAVAGAAGAAGAGSAAEGGLLATGAGALAAVALPVGIGAGLALLTHEIMNTGSAFEDAHKHFNEVAADLEDKSVPAWKRTREAIKAVHEEVGQTERNTGLRALEEHKQWGLKGALLPHAAGQEHVSQQDMQKAMEPLRKAREEFATFVATINLDQLAGLGRLNSDLEQALGAADNSWKRGTQGWRTHVVEAMKETVHSIKAGMASGSINAEAGQQRIDGILSQIHLIEGNDPLGLAQGVMSSFRQAGNVTQSGIKELIHDLELMPPGAREQAQDAILEMANAWAKGHPKLEHQVDVLRHNIVQSVGETKKAAGRKWHEMTKGLSTDFGNLAGSVGSSAENIQAVVNSMLTQLNVGKTINFGIKHGNYAGLQGKEAKGIGQQEGGIVPGSGDGDTVPWTGQAGAFVLNREATAAFGFDRGGAVPLMLEPGERYFGPGEVSRIGRRNLEWMNTAVSRFQQGGEVGKEPHITGPKGPLLAIGQGATHLMWKAAQKYIAAHRPKGGPGYSGPGIGPKGTSTYMGVVMATWVAEALRYAAAHGSGNPQPTSGYRTEAESAALGYPHDEHTVPGPYPHGAVDFGGMVDPAAAPIRDAVVRATRSFKYPLLHPIGFHDDGHASGTGHQLGGLVRALMSVGGPVPPAKGELVGASYYGGPSDPSSGTVGSSGVSLPGKMAFAELAMGKALGDLPYHTKLKISRGGKSVIAEKLDIGAGGDDVNGYNRAIDLWYQTAQAIGMPGTGVVKVSPADGSVTSGAKGPTEAQKKRAEGKKKKAHREALLKQLRQAVASAKTLPGKRAAMWRLAEFWGEFGLFDKDSRAKMLAGVREAAGEVNPLAAIPDLAHLFDYLNDHVEISGRELGDKSLKSEVERVRKSGTKVGDRRRKHVEKKIDAQGLDKARRDLLEEVEREVARKNETIDIHGRLASSETGPGGSEYTDGETADLTGLNQGLLGSLFRKQGLIKTIIGDLEARIAAVTKEIKAARPANSQTHWKLASLIKNREDARSLIGEMRTGLESTQGVTGEGGEIFDVKMALEELGAPKAPPDISAWTAAKEALAKQTAENLALAEGELQIFGGFFRELGPGIPYLGAFMQGTGGMRVGSSGLAMLHRDEMVTPDPKGPAGSQFAGAQVNGDGTPQITLVLTDRAGQLVELVDARVDGRLAKVDTQLGSQARRMSVAPGR